MHGGRHMRVDMGNAAEIRCGACRKRLLCSASTISGSSSSPGCCSTSRRDPTPPISSGAARNWAGAAARLRRSVSAPAVWSMCSACAIGLSALLDGVGHRLYAREMGRRGLSLLHRHQDAAVADRRARRRPSRSAIASHRCKGVLAGRADQRAQSEGGAVLPRLPAAIRRRRSAAQGARLSALGLIFIFNGTLWCLGVAAFAARAARRVRQSGRAMRWINRALGGMFVYLGARIAMLRRDTSGQSDFRPDEACRSRCPRDRARERSSRSGTSGGTLPPASASAPPGR